LPGLQFLLGRDVLFEQGQHLGGDGTAAGLGAAAERFIEIVGDVFEVVPALTQEMKKYYGKN